MNRQSILLVSWLLAVVALIATQYSSIVLHIPPCELCWYQRICYYPLVFILGIGAFQNDRRAAIYSLPLMLSAIALSLYQYLLQMVPGWKTLTTCSAGGAPSCSDTHFLYWGFITYPLISLVGSVVLSILLITALVKKT